jgi:hypothetical protein
MRWNTRVYWNVFIQPHLRQIRYWRCEFRHGSEIVVVVNAGSDA